MKNYLGPTLATPGLGDEKIMIWDHNRSLMYQRAQGVLDDPRPLQICMGRGLPLVCGRQF